MTDTAAPVPGPTQEAPARLDARLDRQQDPGPDERGDRHRAGRGRR